MLKKTRLVGSLEVSDGAAATGSEERADSAPLRPPARRRAGAQRPLPAALAGLMLVGALHGGVRPRLRRREQSAGRRSPSSWRGGPGSHPGFPPPPRWPPGTCPGAGSAVRHVCFLQQTAGWSYRSASPGAGEACAHRWFPWRPRRFLRATVVVLMGRKVVPENLARIPPQEAEMKRDKSLMTNNPA